MHLDFSWNFQYGLFIHLNTFLEYENPLWIMYMVWIGGIWESLKIHIFICKTPTATTCQKILPSSSHGYVIIVLESGISERHSKKRFLLSLLSPSSLTTSKGYIDSIVDRFTTVKKTSFSFIIKNIVICHKLGFPIEKLWSENLISAFNIYDRLSS